MKRKLLRITTISDSLFGLLKGQLNFFNHYYDVVGVASGNKCLTSVALREGVRVIDVPMRREINLLFDVQSLIILVALFIKERPYIVHTNTPKASLLSMIAAWITRVPNRIYTVTGLRFETTTGTLRYVLMIMERITCWCATKVIPEGEGVKRTLLAEKITNKTLHVILNGNINGIDIEYFQRSRDVILSADIFMSNSFTYIFVGRLVKDKGINELIHAFVRLYQRYSGIRLLLVGSFDSKLDPLEENTYQLIHNHEAISFVGFQEDVRPCFAAADVLTFPSYREGFPNVVLQAGAMGLPAIVTDISGCNEIIKDGVNGKIIKPKDETLLYETMKWFYEHKDGEVLSMAKQARPMVVSRYEQNKVWEALLKEYQSLE